MHQAYDMKVFIVNGYDINFSNWQEYVRGVNSYHSSMEDRKMKKVIILSAISIAATLLYAQQRRQHVPCPIDGQQMDWDGNQQGTGRNSSCEFSHIAFVDGQRTTHKAWASCVVEY